MEMSVSILVSPSAENGHLDVVVKVLDHRPVALGSGYVALDQEIDVPGPDQFRHLQSYLLAILAKLSHEIANDIEEAGYTTIADLMLKLSEHH